MKIIPKIIFFIGRSIYAIFGLIFLLVATYFFGYSLLRSPLSGSDSANSLTMINWINRFFPHIPLWWPAQGGGVSFILGYGTLYHFTVVVLARLFHFSLTQTMGLVNFLSILLPCWGIYSLVSWRFKNQTAALIAGFFYLLSPISYVWNNGAGFLAQTFSWIFVPPAIAFFDWYFESRKKIALFLVTFFTTLAMIAHPITGLGLVIIYSFYFFFAWLLGVDKKKLLRQLSFSYFLLIISIFSLVSFWFFPFYRYISFANREINPDIRDIKILPPLDFLSGLNITSWRRIDMGGWYFVKVVWIPALVMVILSFLGQLKKVRTWGLVSILAVWVSLCYGAWHLIVLLSPKMAGFFTPRYFAGFSIIMVPVLAALFFTSLWETLISFLPRVIRLIFVPSLAIISASLAVYFLNFMSPFPKNKNFFYYGPFHGAGSPGINIKTLWNRPAEERCDQKSKIYLPIFCENPYIKENFEINTLAQFCENYDVRVGSPKICLGYDQKTTLPLNKEQVEEFVKDCQKKTDNISLADVCLATAKDLTSQIKRWPKPFLEKKGVQGTSSLPFLKLAEETERIDISPSLGDWIKSWNAYSQSSLINVYTGMLCLNKPYQSLFIDAFYSNQAIYDSSPEVLNNLASYFGVSGVIVSENDPDSRFKATGWQKKIDGERQWWNFPYPGSLLTLTKKPSILIIGQENRRPYETIFRLANLGALPYENGILVQGEDSGFIDDYKLTELEKFDLIILHGYRYHNFKRTWQMLEKYVFNGGRIFIETGWQYVSQDWQQELTPAIFPMNSLKWQSLGKTSDYQIEGELKGEIEVSNFSPLIWEGQSWGVSSNGRENLREWADPVLTVSDRVLVAKGNLGQGKVIWSGMALFNHAFDKQNKEEVKFINYLFNWLLKEKAGADLKASYKRDNPDKIEIEFQESSDQVVTLFWRESFHPNWQATLIANGRKEKLKIYPGGPEFMLIRLKANDGDKVIFKFKRLLVEKIASLVSVVTLILFIFLIVDSLVFKEKMLKLAKGKLGLLSFKRERLKTWWADEEI